MPRAEPFIQSPSGGEFLVELGRAFAGALLFSLPLLMTMEMWQIGMLIAPYRLTLLIGLTVPLLVVLSRYGGIRPTFRLWDDIADSFVAITIAFVASSLLLLLLGVIGPGMAWREIIGVTALQMVPASIGAMLAQNQLRSSGDENEERRKKRPTYAGEIFLMVVGALFLSLNAAPTEEIVLLSYKMSIWQQVGLVVVSLAILHVFVYEVDFGGTEDAGPHASLLDVFFRFAVVGYAAVFLVSLYLLWTFGNGEWHSLKDTVSTAVVLSFPGAVGAAAARLIL